MQVDYHRLWERWESRGISLKKACSISRKPDQDISVNGSGGLLPPGVRCLLNCLGIQPGGGWQDEFEIQPALACAVLLAYYFPSGVIIAFYYWGKCRRQRWTNLVVCDFWFIRSHGSPCHLFYSNKKLAGRCTPRNFRFYGYGYFYRTPGRAPASIYYFSNCFTNSNHNMGNIPHPIPRFTVIGTYTHGLV